MFFEFNWNWFEYSNYDYDFQIKERFEELGKEDWMWDDEAGHSIKEIGYSDNNRYSENEEFVNYIVE